MAVYTKYKLVIKARYESRVLRPLKNPVTKAEFCATECDLRVPSSNRSAKPMRRGFFASSASACRLDFSSTLEPLVEKSW